jgi:hypothetical protein
MAYFHRRFTKQLMWKKAAVRENRSLEYLFVVAPQASCVEVPFLVIGTAVAAYRICSTYLKSSVSRFSWSPEIRTSSIGIAQTSMFFIWGRRQNTVTKTLFQIKNRKMNNAQKVNNFARIIPCGNLPQSKKSIAKQRLANIRFRGNTFTECSNGTLGGSDFYSVLYRLP